MRLFILTSFALLAFAGNSVLCRLALASASIDAASFTFFRLISGALVLFALLLVRRAMSGEDIFPRENKKLNTGSWWAAFYLCVYAFTFSFAYLALDTGTGALILFVSVQITIILLSLLKGQRLARLEWFGLLLALLGFGYLMAPSIGTPSIMGFLLMLVSGISWGLYTLAGQSSLDALSDTAYNFMKTLPLLALFMALCLVMGLGSFQFTAKGMTLALLSGGLTSGLGYAIWYAVLPNLTSTQAAVVQLLVPALAALGGVMFTHETIAVRLLVSSILILMGIVCVIHAHSRHLNSK